MLIGENHHVIDEKGRVFIPAKFRDDLGESFVISKGLDKCLFIYSKKEWKTFEDKLNSLPMSKGRDLQRYFFAGAEEVEMDKQGRITIPPMLREHAGLDREVVINGASTRAEIWDKQRWLEINRPLTPELIAEKMDEINI